VFLPASMTVFPTGTVVVLPTLVDSMLPTGAVPTGGRVGKQCT
jgi:hypothetical protein